MKKTQRGFSYQEFKDTRGNKCSIQKSSIATEDRIWLGSNELGLEGFYPNTHEPWRPLTEMEIKIKFGCIDIVDNCRMELNRKQVARLIPLLQKFVDTGDFI